MNEITTTKPLRKETILAQLGRLACHYPNSGHSKESMEIVAVDWLKEFSKVSDEGFVRIVDATLRDSRFFPVIADLWAASKTTGLCEQCKYRNICDAKKKGDKNYGECCDSFIPGKADISRF